MRIFTAIVFAVGIVLLPLAGYAGQARTGGGAARFEITSLRAVRPNIQKLIVDLQKKDQAAAKDDIEAFDAAWIGVEVYVNTRNMDIYNDIEHNWEAKLEKELSVPGADLAAALSDAQALLKSYDAMLDYVAKAPPLNSKFDDVARLRIERSHLRDVQNFLKEARVADAKKAWTAFDDNWDNIEDLREGPLARGLRLDREEHGDAGEAVDASHAERRDGERDDHGDQHRVQQDRPADHQGSTRR